jgi:hypothetical protein
MKQGLGVVLLVALVTMSGCGAVKEAGKVKDLASGKTAKKIQDFQKRSEAAAKLTYTADYEGQSKGNQPEKVHIAQKPPKSIYSQGDTQVIDDGSKTYICSPDGNTPPKIQCLESGPSGVNPQGFTQVLSSTAVFAGLTALAIIPGVNVKESTRSVAGENLDCISIEANKKKFESCVTKDGILGFTDDGDGNVFTLTSFKRSASDSDFKLPGKAVTQQDLIDQATSTTSTTSTTEDRSTTTTSEDTTTTTVDDSTSTTGG